MTFDTILQRVSGLKLRGGLVGKTSQVLLVACAALGAIGATGQNAWVSGISILAIVVLVLVIPLCLIRFANQNPQAALMEGAELLVHQAQILRSKGGTEMLISTVAVTDELGSRTDEGTLPIDDDSDDSAPEVSDSEGGR